MDGKGHIEPIYNQQTPKVTKHTEVTDEIKQLANQVLVFAQRNENPKLAGLAANQLAYDGKRIMEKICIIRQEDDIWVTAINPSIIKRSKKINERNREGCLTWPDKLIVADRHESITVSYTTTNDEKKIIEADGYEATIWQHEINHLEGVVEEVINPKSGKIFGPSTEDGGTIIADKKLGPNKSCPCGSNKKYKKCCGR